MLLSEGQADITLQDEEGITALHWACSSGHMEAIPLLISAGANPNAMELDGERLTPLDYAIIGGHQDVAQLLIENGALSISSIRELASIMIQKCIRGYLTRKKTLPLLEQRRATMAMTELPSGSGRSPAASTRDERDGGERAESAASRRLREEELAKRRQ